MSETMEQAGPGSMEQDIRRFHGKYRGTVVNSTDPLNLGRIQAMVPEVLGAMPTGWAWPCAPFVGNLAGFFAIPLVGSYVWIEFEAGDPSRPIWVGGFWPSGRVPMGPAGAQASQFTKIFRSDTGMIVMLDDSAGTVTLSDVAGTNKVEVSMATGTVTIKGLVRVVVDSKMIFTGSESAAHPAVFGDSLLTYLTELVMKFNAHMHPGQMAAAVPVSPAPPQPPLSPPTPSLLSKKILQE